MNISGIRYEPFSEKDYNAARELLSYDVDASEGILRVLDEEPELLITAFIEDKLVALAQVNEPASQSYLTVFVSPPFRRQGIGTAMVKYAENALRVGGTQKVRSSFRAGHQSSLAFARKLGYDKYFSTAYMQRAGDSFPLKELPVKQYTDEDYLLSQSLYAIAFHEMRVRVGCFPDSVIEQPSEKGRRAWKEDAENRFVYEINGEIVAYSRLCGNEISSISVRTDYQGLGIGRKFVMYLCNEIYQRGSGTVDLCCVVGNDARNLYDSLGFREKYIMELMRKTL
ncbi:GNAT family N-acetyltransferase [Paenibacillus selenitireducens]|uniref:GNAT family N-acetyltransferase n=1 Tax=Paenibacillus selenitireducens TaxID=1324314 RepID=A0A1T2XH22_9BACL|nr:GNAT family N-acetyltransferase [Paenibacillus selenitireducens]OPA79092.1 GNAT family N-acetyltransferase [Paenibacillus selenitireducens]